MTSPASGRPRERSLAVCAADDRIGDARDVVVLHVLADAAQFMHDRHADLRPRCSGSPTPDSCRMCGEPIAPADRITSRAASARSTRAAAREFDAGRALAVEQDAVDQRVGDELQVRPLQRRAQIGARGAGAAAAAAGLLAPADAVAGAGRQVVDVLAVFEADLLAGLDHRRADRRPVRLRGEERPVLAAHLAALALPALGLAEIGQAIVPRPAAIAELRPVVVILGLAADVDQPVDRGGAADHPAARIDDRAAVGAGIGLGAELPGQGLVVEHLEEAGRDVDQRVPVAPARLDQQDFGAGILGQPVGQHAAGRARADDDVIRLHVLRSLHHHVRPTAKPLIRS